MTYNHLEDTIKKLYLKIGVIDPSELDAATIAERLNFSIYDINGICKYIDSHKTFYMSRNISPQLRWQNFGHELCHALWHAGSQLDMKIEWREYQEWKANNFAYEACVPRFMLEKVLEGNPLMNPVYLIMERFGVTYQFAETRYILYCVRKSQYENDMSRLARVY